jgi:hypothetical protein
MSWDLPTYQSTFGRLRSSGIFFAILALSTVGPSSQCFADTIQFHLKSKSQYMVELKFFSQTRNYVWPAPGKIYYQNDDAIYDYNLTCSSQEKICYGAWTMPGHHTVWGVGDDGKRACKGCCGVCGENVASVDLVDADVPGPPPQASAPDAQPPPAKGPLYAGEDASDEIKAACDASWFKICIDRQDRDGDYCNDHQSSEILGRPGMDSDQTHECIERAGNRSQKCLDDIKRHCHD